MEARAEQFVLDYLRRLEDAARRALEPDEFRAFMSRSRATIARQVAESRAAGAGDVQRLLRRFGDPGKLVAHERRRLDGPAKRDGGQQGPRRPQDPPAAGRPAATPAARRQRPAATTAPGRRPSAAPALRRPATARWRPGADLAVAPRAAAPALRNLTGWPGFPRWTGSAHRPGSPGLVSSGSTASAGPPGPPAPGPPGPPGPSGSAAPVGPPSSPAPPAPGPPGLSAPAGAAGLPASAQPGPPWLSGVLTPARRHPLECGAILLLGLGGLVDPFPLWLFGALVVLVSRLWDGRDKLTAVAVPLAVAFLGAIALAGLTAKAASLSGYAHTVRADGWDLIRAGSVLGAVYLARRVRQGPRPLRQPPWRRLPQR